MDGEYQIDREIAKILEICIKNPIDVFQSDEKLLATTALLSKMIELIEKDKISLETREHKKSVKDARSIIENKTLAELKENIDRLNSRKQALDDFHQKSPLLKKKTELEHALERHTLDLEHVKKSLEELRRDLERCDEEIDKNKYELEGAASKVMGTTVKITS
jgi:chromosome segregation ATPase